MTLMSGILGANRGDYEDYLTPCILIETSTRLNSIISQMTVILHPNNCRKIIHHFMSFGHIQGSVKTFACSSMSSFHNQSQRVENSYSPAAI
jgi:hypothetical protein